MESVILFSVDCSKTLDVGGVYCAGRDGSGTTVLFDPVSIVSEMALTVVDGLNRIVAVVVAIAARIRRMVPVEKNPSVAADPNLTDFSPQRNQHENSLFVDHIIISANSIMYRHQHWIAQ